MKKATKSAAKLVVLENNDPISAENEEIQNRIRERAYELCQQRGHTGREMDDWLKAESEIISVPPADLIEKDGTFQVRFAIVGIDLQDMRIMTSPDQMLVRADYRYEPDPNGTIHLSDFKSATAFRSVQFPQRIDVNRVDIEYQDGILRMTAAKAGVARMAAKRTVQRKSPAKKRRASEVRGAWTSFRWGCRALRTEDSNHETFRNRGSSSARRPRTAVACRPHVETGHGNC